MAKRLLVKNILLTLSAAVLLSGTSFGQDLERIKGFADHLYNNKDYYRAATEYGRLLFLHPKPPYGEAARMGLGLSLAGYEQWDDAVRSLEPLVESGGPYRYTAQSEIGLVYLLTSRYAAARSELNGVVKSSAPYDVRAQAALWTGYAFAKEARWADASRYLSEASGEGLEPGRFSGWALTLEGGGALKKKSPKLAGWMSALLPGAGQFYAGEKSNALVAFILNSGFIYLSINAIKNDQPALGGVLAFFELGWYSGNIYTSIGAAHRHNRNRRKEFIHSIWPHEPPRI